MNRRNGTQDLGVRDKRRLRVLYERESLENLTVRWRRES